MTNTTYPPITPTLMANSLGLMREDSRTAAALFTQLNYLPALHDQLQCVVIRASASSQVLRDTALTAKMELEKNIKELDLLKNTLADSQATKDIHAAKANLLNKTKLKVRDYKELLLVQLASLSSPLPRDITQRYLGEFEQEHVAADASLNLLIENKNTLQEERKIITAGIDALSAGGVEKLGREMTMTLESITSLGLAPTQVQIIMLALEQLKKAINQIGEGIRFLDMLQQRDMLIAKIKTLNNAITQKNKEITALKGQTSFINTLNAIDHQLHIYTGEYQQTIDTFKLFIANMDTDFQTEAQKFIQFLNPLSKPW